MSSKSDLIKFATTAVVSYFFWKIMRPRSFQMCHNMYAEQATLLLNWSLALPRLAFIYHLLIDLESKNNCTALGYEFRDCIQAIVLLFSTSLTFWIRIHSWMNASIWSSVLILCSLRIHQFGHILESWHVTNITTSMMKYNTKFMLNFL
jgi:hypothetical protein